MEWKAIGSNMLRRLPAALGAGLAAYYTYKKTNMLTVTSLAAAGGYTIVTEVQSLLVKYLDPVDTLPEAMAHSLEETETPVATPTVEAPVTSTTTPEEVGSNVVDINPSASTNMDAFGSVGSE